MLAIWTLLFVAGYCLATAASDTTTVMVLTDIHYDVDYQYHSDRKVKYCRKVAEPPESSPYAKYSRDGCDSSKDLVDDSFHNINQVLLDQNIQPKVLLMLGDLPAHNLNTYQKNRDASFYAAYKMNKSFNKIPNIIPVIGNNEAYFDYELNANNDVDPQLVDLLAIYNKLGWITTGTEKNNFLKGGYYYKDIGNIRYIVLSTTYYSFKFYPGFLKEDGKYLEDPVHQFEFLEKALFGAKLRDLSAHILVHIGPGGNGYDPQNVLWIDEYAGKFDSIIKHYNDLVKVIHIGHFHQDMHRFTTATRNQYSTENYNSIPGFVYPSISPSNSNNPGVRFIDVDTKTGMVLDYTQYYADLDMSNFLFSRQNNTITYKRQYKFTEMYKECIKADDKRPTGNNIFDLTKAMAENQKCWAKWWLNSSMLYNSDKMKYSCSSYVIGDDSTKNDFSTVDIKNYAECVTYYT